MFYLSLSISTHHAGHQLPEEYHYFLISCHMNAIANYIIPLPLSLIDLGYIFLLSHTSLSKFKIHVHLIFVLISIYTNVNVCTTWDKECNIYSSLIYLNIIFPGIKFSTNIIILSLHPNIPQLYIYIYNIYFIYSS